MTDQFQNLKEILNTQNVTICLLDIDDFNRYNFEFSFELGDKVLQNIDTYINNIQTIVHSIRLGSDEYIFSCEGDFESNKEFLFKLMQDTERNLEVTISIGVVETSEKLSQPEEVLKQLKLNLMKAKENGKNRLLVK
jgi:diguanylate cyclase (GGDEF)-like protein